MQLLPSMHAQAGVASVSVLTLRQLEYVLLAVNDLQRAVTHQAGNVASVEEAISICACDTTAACNHSVGQRGQLRCTDAILLAKTGPSNVHCL
jgi:hypothetical protein